MSRIYEMVMESVMVTEMERVVVMDSDGDGDGDGEGGGDG